MKIIVHSAICGDYDQPKPHPGHHLVDRWLLRTDSPATAERARQTGWEAEVYEPAHEHPRMAAKWFKTHPPEADISIWVDGSVNLLENTGGEAALVDVMVDLLYQPPGELDQGADMALFRHPARTDIRDEAGFSHAVLPRKYPWLDRMVAQVDAYEGKPRTTLYASTMFAVRHSVKTLAFGGAWYAHNEIYTYQDQLSLPVLLAQYRMWVADIPGELYANPWTTVTPHATEV